LTMTAVEAIESLRAQLSTIRHLSADLKGMETHFSVVALVPLPTLRHVSRYATYPQGHSVHGMLQVGR
jgi:hypothetical protein